MEICIVVVAWLLAVIAGMCFRMARLHLKLAGLNRLVADMLADPGNALVYAHEHRRKELGR